MNPNESSTVPTFGGLDIEENTASLQTQVPVSPMKLAENHLACDCCGIAVEITSAAQIFEVERLGNFNRLKEPTIVRVSRCPSCVAVLDEAAAYIDAHPHHAARMGNVAQERVEQALFALQVLDRPRPSEAIFEAAWPRLWPAASRMRWGNPASVPLGLCLSRPWTHVSLEQRQQLREAYAVGLSDYTARSQAPMAISCPTGGCLFCGVEQVAVPAVEVSRLDGIQAATRATWRSLATFPSALGGSGPDEVRGHLCPGCSRALDSVGAVGVAARAQAVVNHVQASLGDGKARRLSERLALDFPPLMPAWAAQQREPNPRPWEHLGEMLAGL